MYYKTLKEINDDYISGCEILGRAYDFHKDYEVYIEQMNALLSDNTNKINEYISVTVSIIEKFYTIEKKEAIENFKVHKNFQRLSNALDIITEKYSNLKGLRTYLNP